MCTAVSYRTRHHYFGRNLDLERGYGEQVVITPRNFPFSFRYAGNQRHHYAMIGMAAVVEDYPLYFEATNENGLSMAGLNFPRNACYGACEADKENVAPFELIPYLLGSCSSVEEVKARLEKLQVVHCDFSPALPVSPLHWLIADGVCAIVLECTAAGMQVYDDPFGVLTNNPGFAYHRLHVSDYMALHAVAPENRLCPEKTLERYSLGMGAMGLPGDFSSSSRFVKAVFVKENSVCDGSEKESVNQFFHILRSVAMPKGCVVAENGDFEYTRYSCCCNTDTRVYYYTTYHNMSLRSVALQEADLEQNALCCTPVEE